MPPIDPYIDDRCPAFGCNAGQVPCASCHGSALFRAYDGELVPCGSCFATGLVPCSFCRGTGRRVRPAVRGDAGPVATAGGGTGGGTHAPSTPSRLGSADAGRTAPGGDSTSRMGSVATAIAIACAVLVALAIALLLGVGAFG